MPPPQGAERTVEGPVLRESDPRRINHRSSRDDRLAGGSISRFGHHGVARGRQIGSRPFRRRHDVQILRSQGLGRMEADEVHPAPLEPSQAAPVQVLLPVTADVKIDHVLFGRQTKLLPKLVLPVPPRRDDHSDFNRRRDSHETQGRLRAKQRGRVPIRGSGARRQSRVLPPSLLACGA